MLPSTWQMISALLSGAFVNGICVLWVRYAESSRPLLIGITGSVEAAAILLGLNVSLSSLPCAALYVLGYGIGPAIVVAIRRRWESVPVPRCLRRHHTPYGRQE